MDSQGLPSAGWWVAAAGAIATFITWLFKVFSTNKEVQELKVDVKAHIAQYNKDRLVTQQIYDVFVREGKIK